MEQKKKTQKKSFLHRTKEFVQKKKDAYKRFEQRLLGGTHNVEIIVILGIAALTATFATWFPSQNGQQTGIFVNGVDTAINVSTTISSTNSTVINVDNIRVDLYGKQSLASSITDAKIIVKHSYNPNSMIPSIDNVRITLDGSDILNSLLSGTNFTGNFTGMVIRIAGDMDLGNAEEKVALVVNGKAIPRKYLKNGRIDMYVNGVLVLGNGKITPAPEKPAEPTATPTTTGTTNTETTETGASSTGTVPTPVETGSTTTGGDTTGTVNVQQIPLQARGTIGSDGVAQLQLYTSVPNTYAGNWTLMGREYTTNPTDGSVTTKDYQVLIKETSNNPLAASTTYHIVNMMPIASAGTTETAFLLTTQSAAGMTQQFVMTARPNLQGGYSLGLMTSSIGGENKDRTFSTIPSAGGENKDRNFSASMSSVGGENKDRNFSAAPVAGGENKDRTFFAESSSSK